MHFAKDFDERLVFEKSIPGAPSYEMPKVSTPNRSLPPAFSRQEHLDLPELPEIEVMRHFLNLSKKTFGVDYGTYPLGSCTMKYNPKINDMIANLEGFAALHPFAPYDHAQGTLELLYKGLEDLCEITGMSWGTLQPCAGAHGEYTTLRMFKAYFKSRGEDQRRVMLIPTSAHGTNPASAHMAGFDVQEVAPDERGCVTIDSIRPYLNENLAGIMLTNPSTYGLFEEHITEVAEAIHEAGGLLYYDGANLNAIMGHVRPGDMGFDGIHLNVHKTFSTPHGGGGPGAGPVLVKEHLRPFLPRPNIVKIEHSEDDTRYEWDWEQPESIGKVSAYYGNVGVLLRAMTYVRVLGAEGIPEASAHAVLGANYLQKKLKDEFYLPYDRPCMHEFVLSMKKLKEETGISSLDVAKGLLDRGIHPPTIYFPLDIPEAAMFEPTETESKERLDLLIQALLDIKAEAGEKPELMHERPLTMPITRIDEVLAARQPVVRWKKDS